MTSAFTEQAAYSRLPAGTHMSLHTVHRFEWKALRSIDDSTEHGLALTVN